MSPKRRGRKHRRPQHRPHAARRAHVESAQALIPPELMSLMLGAGKDIARSEGPFGAEVIASSLVGVWWGRELIDADVEEVIGEAMVTEAGRRRTAEGLCLLRSVAAVTEGRLAIEAATAANALDEVGVIGPPWLDRVGTARVVDCWRSWDVTGDGTNVFVRYSYTGETPHVLSWFSSTATWAALPKTCGAPRPVTRCSTGCARRWRGRTRCGWRRSIRRWLGDWSRPRWR